MLRKRILSFLALSVLALNSVSYAKTNVATNHCPCPTKEEFKNSTRMLWEDHIQWTRSYLVSAVGKLGDQEVVLARLMKNQADIGASLKPYYGEQAALDFTALLNDHIKFAGAIVAALMVGDKDGATKASDSWYINANDIAVFLNKANPNHFPLDAWQAMMKAHLDETAMEVNAQIAGDWQGSVDAYDKIHAHILDMADALSLGIIKQFPDKFGCPEL